MKGKVFLEKNVYEMAKERIKQSISMFDKIYVSLSWGKDSLVCLYLVEEVYKELWIKEKINIIFRDEELIEDSVIDFLKELYYSGKYNFKWLCVKMKSNKYVLWKTIEYIQWDDTRENLREKPDFALQYDWIFDQYSLDKIQCEGDEWYIWFITWVRADESLVRLSSIMNNKKKCFISNSSYKYAKLIKPIYDWAESDIFKYLYDNNIKYSKIYDIQFLNGEWLRVSTPLHSESAKRFNKIKTRNADFYQKLVNIFPEMILQEKYFKDLDRFWIIDNYMPTEESLYEFIENELDESLKQKAKKRIKTALVVRRNNIQKWRVKNFWWYPFLYLYTCLVNWNFKREILPKNKLTLKELEFEKKWLKK